MTMNNHSTTKKLVQPRPLIVLGSFRGGTSATCGVLRELGVFVGRRFWHCSYQTFEAIGLRSCIDKCFDCGDDQWRHLGDHRTRVEKLQRWIRFAKQEAVSKDHHGVGGKHPLMCMLVDELAEAWQGDDGRPPLFISVIRPAEEVLSSWDRAMRENGWFPRKDRQRMVHDLIRNRDKSLEHHDHIRFEFAALRKDPRRAITELANHCGLPLDNLHKAIDFVS